MIETTGNTDSLLKEAEPLLKKYSGTEYKIMIQLIVRKHLLTKKDLPHSKKQQVIDKVFGKNNRKLFLLSGE